MMLPVQGQPLYHIMIHIANSAVEEEYAIDSESSLTNSFTTHKLCLQLQFLPLLFCHPTDRVAVTALPDEKYLSRMHEWLGFLPHLNLLNDSHSFKGLECHPWGHSKQVQKWAHEKQAIYHLPKW